MKHIFKIIFLFILFASISNAQNCQTTNQTFQAKVGIGSCNTPTNPLTVTGTTSLDPMRLIGNKTATLPSVTGVLTIDVNGYVKTTPTAAFAGQDTRLNNPRMTGVNGNVITFDIINAATLAVLGTTSVTLNNELKNATIAGRVITFTRSDGTTFTITLPNDANTSFTSSGNTLSITDAAGTLTAPSVNSVSNAYNPINRELTTTVNGVSSSVIIPDDDFCEQVKSVPSGTYNPNMKVLGYDSGGSSVPAGWVGYDFDIPNDFPGATDATDLYLHIIEMSTSYYLPPATTNPTTPVVATDVATIQSFLNTVLVAEGFAANDLVWIVNADNTITVWANPTYPINGSEFWAGSATPDDYTNKLFPVIPTTHTAPLGSCALVELPQNNWSLMGNSGTDGGVTNWIGTNDAKDFVIHTNGTEIGRFGQTNNIAFGVLNTASAQHAVVTGGNSNTASGYASFVGNGELNISSNDYTVICGGTGNIANNYTSFVGGGSANTSSGSQSTISGGGQNTASGTNTTIGGGSANTAYGNNATIGGGESNSASVSYSTIGGGGSNVVNGEGGTVSGGISNTAHSYGEWVGGVYSTNYTPNSTTSWDGNDYIFRVGNGIDDLNRSDAIQIKKNGEVILPSYVSAPFLGTNVNGKIIPVSNPLNPTPTKVATFNGDIDVTGTIDPTRILFSNLAGVNSPTYNPSANGNNYSVMFEQGGHLNFQSNTTNNILHLNNNGNVGIGTATPTEILDVVGKTKSSTGFYSQLINMVTNSPYAGIPIGLGSGANKPVTILANTNAAGSNWLKFDKPNVGSNDSKSWIGAVYNGNFTDDLYFYSGKKGNFVYGDNAALNLVLSQDGILFSTAVAGNNTSTEKMRITGTGNVGIGTVSPLSTLDLNGSVRNAARVVTATTTLLPTDNIILVQNGATNITITIPTTLHEVVISRSVGSTGTVTIVYAGGTIEALAGTVGATTSLAALGAIGDGRRFRRDPLVTTRMDIVRQ